jgi:phosphomannomutase
MLATPKNPEQILSHVQFGTDGWRAIINKDFNTGTLARVAEATAKVFREDNPLAPTQNNDEQGHAPQSDLKNGSEGFSTKNTIIIGYDCRQDAGRYAAFFAAIIARHGFDVRISDSYCPTPALCWSVAHEPQAVGGVMLTSSHNPAEWLGVKLRMSDGGASPKAFSDRVEDAMQLKLPESYERALQVAELAGNGEPGLRAQPISIAPELHFVDLMQPYLNELFNFVDTKAISAANLRVVVDPLYGAGRGYLSALLAAAGVEVVEINNASDPSFAGLHPEPILPWIKAGLDKTSELGYDACFITDGDADRIGAGDAQGNFVNPHRILTLLVAHLMQRDTKGALPNRVVRTLSGSNLVKRQCERLGLKLTTTPIGFKWIYEQMLSGDVLIGGEESGGIGIPTHVRERDGLLMALLLTELMALKGKGLGVLVSDLLTDLGNFDYARRDLKLNEEQKSLFMLEHAHASKLACEYQHLFDSLAETITAIDRRDGLHLSFASDAWLLMRPSGTEPLVRVYAEATTTKRVQELLDIGCSIASGTKLLS